MSAFLVNPEHIAAIVAYAEKTTPSGKADFYLNELINQNFASVKYRYPLFEDGNQPGFKMSKKDYTELANAILQDFMSIEVTLAKEEFEKLNKYDIYNMITCFRYQSCETDNYNETQAFLSAGSCSKLNT